MSPLLVKQLISVHSLTALGNILGQPDDVSEFWDSCHSMASPILHIYGDLPMTINRAFSSINCFMLAISYKFFLQ